MHYLYATSTLFVLFGVFVPSTSTTDIKSPPELSINMHNLIDSRATASNETNDDKTNNIQNGNANAVVSTTLSPSLYAAVNSSNKGIHQQQQNHHNVDNQQNSWHPMENSQKYLHLDEYNFVATTPKIQTTKLPNR